MTKSCGRCRHFRMSPNPDDDSSICVESPPHPITFVMQRPAPISGPNGQPRMETKPVVIGSTFPAVALDGLPCSRFMLQRKKAAAKRRPQLGQG